MEQTQILVYENLSTAFLWDEDRRMYEDLIKNEEKPCLKMLDRNSCKTYKNTISQSPFLLGGVQGSLVSTMSLSSCPSL